MANKKYKLDNSDYWETSGVYDLAQSKTQRQINADVQTSLNGKVPTDRTVNNKALSSNITLASGDIGDDSDAGGTTVKASLTTLKGALTSVEGDVSDLQGALTSEAEARQQADSTLQGAIDNGFGKYDIILDTTNRTWESGGISTVGANNSMTNRIRTSFINIPYSKITVKSQSPYEFSIRIFKGTDTTKGLYYYDSQWHTEKEYEIPTNCAVRLIYRKSDDSDITPSIISAATAPTITVYPENMPAKKINKAKILFLGNSKSRDSSACVPEILGDLGYLNVEVLLTFTGAATLQDHYDNRNTAFFEQYRRYRKNVYGWVSETVVPLTQVIADNPDITHVIFQQQTDDSIDSTSYSCLNDLVSLFDGCTATPKFYIMSVWANDTSTFTTDDMLATSKAVAEANSNIHAVIPTGSCIEKLKSNTVFTNIISSILSDGTHLSSGFPLRMASLSVVEALFGLDDTLYLSNLDDSTYLVNNLCYYIAKETASYGEFFQRNNLDGFYSKRLTGINNASTSTIYDLGLMRSKSAEVVVLFLQTAYNAADTGSCYIVRNAPTGGNLRCFITAVHVGTDNYAPIVDPTTGVLHLKAATTGTTVWATTMLMTQLN